MVIEHSPEVLERFHAELELVEIIANVLAREMPGVDRDELVAAGREGLFDAARRFDPARGTSFKFYAGLRIRGSMMDMVRSTSPLGRYEYYRLAALRAAAEVCEGDWQRLHQGTAISSKGPPETERSFEDHLAALATAAAICLDGDPYSDGDASSGAAEVEDPERAVSRAQLIAHIDRLLAERAITELQREILFRHYFQGEGINQIAREMSVAKSWISRQHTRAIATLHERLTELDSD